MSTAPDSERAPGAIPVDGADGAADVPAAGPATGAAFGLVFDDPLDRPSADDSDHGWGEPLSGRGDDDFTRFLNEKPPHHL